MVEEIQQAIQKKLEEAEKELKLAHEFVTEIDNLFLKDYFTYCKPQKLAEIVVHGILIDSLYYYYVINAICAVVEARGLAKKDIIGITSFILFMFVF